MSWCTWWRPTGCVCTWRDKHGLSRCELEAIVDKLPKCWRLDESGKRVQDVPVVGFGTYFILSGTSDPRSVTVMQIDWFRNSRKPHKKKSLDASITVLVHARPPYLQGERMLTANDLHDTLEAAEAARKEPGS